MFALSITPDVERKQGKVEQEGKIELFEKEEQRES